MKEIETDRKTLPLFRFIAGIARISRLGCCCVLVKLLGYLGCLDDDNDDGDDDDDDGDGDGDGVYYIIWFNSVDDYSEQWVPETEWSFDHQPVISSCVYVM